MGENTPLSGRNPPYVVHFVDNDQVLQLLKDAEHTSVLCYDRCVLYSAAKYAYLLVLLTCSLLYVAILNRISVL